MRAHHIFRSMLPVRIHEYNSTAFSSTNPTLQCSTIAFIIWMRNAPSPRPLPPTLEYDDPIHHWQRSAQSGWLLWKRLDVLCWLLLEWSLLAKCRNNNAEFNIHKYQFLQNPSFVEGFYSRRLANWRKGRRPFLAWRGSQANHHNAGPWMLPTWPGPCNVQLPIYRDPNVNLGKYSKKCDIYSVGLVYDTIFRGESVFSKVPENLFQQELNYFKDNKKKIISKLNCSDQMKEIILGCL